VTENEGEISQKEAKCLKKTARQAKKRKSLNDFYMSITIFSDAKQPKRCFIFIAQFLSIH